MKKLSILFVVLFLGFSSSYIHAFGLDDAKKTKVIAEISAVVSKDGTSEDFLGCVSTKDASVYTTITDKDKMSNLKDMPLSDLEKINEVVQACKIS